MNTRQYFKYYYRNDAREHSFLLTQSECATYKHWIQEGIKTVTQCFENAAGHREGVYLIRLVQEYIDAE